MKAAIFVFLGGGLGSVARYLVGRAALIYTQSIFPWGTLAANVLSCIALGLFVFALSKSEQPAWYIPFFIIGFCGGFSTFSTFSFETLQLLQSGKYIPAILNIGVSMVSCIFILFALSKIMK